MNYSQWLLLIDAPAHPSYNMSKDHVCLELAQRQGVPILRCYRWQLPTLSIGRVQKLSEINLEGCSLNGVAIIRRMTGGKAVLHDGDWTYTVTGPRDLFGAADAQSVLSIYRHLAAVFVRFFTEIGLTVETEVYQPKQRALQASEICFATPAAFEIMCNGKKLLGSAQRLHPEAFLQHGSLPCSPQQEKLQALFTSSKAQQLQEKMTDLQTLGISKTQQAQIPKALVKAFQHVLGVKFEPCAWSEQDENAVQEKITQYPLLNPEVMVMKQIASHSAAYLKCFA